MGMAYHCDRTDCDSWQRADTEHCEFVFVYDNDSELLACCCTLDCLMHWAAAHSEPTQVVDDA